MWFEIDSPVGKNNLKSELSKQSAIIDITNLEESNINKGNVIERLESEGFPEFKFPLLKDAINGVPEEARHAIKNLWLIVGYGHDLYIDGINLISEYQLYSDLYQFYSDQLGLLKNFCNAKGEDKNTFLEQADEDCKAAYWQGQAAKQTKVRTEHLKMLADKGILVQLGTKNPFYIYNQDAFKKLNRTRVYAIDAYFHKDDPNKSNEALNRSLMKVMAVCVNGDTTVQQIHGIPYGRDLSKIKDGDSDALSPRERLFARKKIIISDSVVTAYGGYPKSNQRIIYNKPIDVIISSKAGAQFEMTYLVYQHFIIDPIQNKEEVHDPVFAQRYLRRDSFPLYAEALESLGNNDENDIYSKIKIQTSSSERRYVRRGRDDPNDFFFTAPGEENICLILNKKAYIESLKEDILNELHAINDFAARYHPEKQVYFKATLAGMGFFAKIGCKYDISDFLAPLFFQAYKQVLENYTFENIGFIEFPLFDEFKKEKFIETFKSKDSSFNSTLITYELGRDVLDFTQVNKKYIYAASNPADSYTIPGNETGYSSVEAAMGNNSDIRINQVYLINKNILQPENQCLVNINFADKSVTSQPLSEEQPQGNIKYGIIRSDNYKAIAVAIQREIFAIEKWHVRKGCGETVTLVTLSNDSEERIVPDGVNEILDKLDAANKDGEWEKAVKEIHGIVKSRCSFISRGIGFFSGRDSTTQEWYEQTFQSLDGILRYNENLVQENDNQEVNHTIPWNN